MITISNNATYTHIERKSTFIGYSYAITSEEQVSDILSSIRERHSDAKHIVYAYRVYPNTARKGNSTEPSGTAGAPLLSALVKNNLFNTLIVVVRYFGGVLLGTGGLSRAYGTTAIEALSRSGIHEISQYSVCQLHIAYDKINEFRQICNNNSILILSEHFDSDITVEIAFLHSSTYIDNLIDSQNVSKEKRWL